MCLTFGEWFNKRARACRAVLGALKANLMRFVEMRILRLYDFTIVRFYGILRFCDCTILRHFTILRLLLSNELSNLILCNKAETLKERKLKK